MSLPDYQNMTQEELFNAWGMFRESTRNVSAYIQNPLYVESHDEHWERGCHSAAQIPLGFIEKLVENCEVDIEKDPEA